MGELLRLLNAPCRDVAAWVSAGMDTKLSFAQRWAVRLHLLYCSTCRAYRRHIHLLRELLRLAAAEVNAEELVSPMASSRRPITAPALSPEARQRMKQAIENVHPGDSSS